MTWIFFSKILETVFFLFFFCFYFVKTNHLWLARALFQLLFFQMIFLRKRQAKRPDPLVLISIFPGLMDQVNICVLRFLPRVLKKVILYCQNFITQRLLILSFVMLTRGVEKTNPDFLFTGLLILLLATMTLTSCAANFLGLVSGSRSTRKVHIQPPNSPKKLPKLFSAFKKVMRLVLIQLIASLIPVSENFLMKVHSLLLIK